MVTDHRAVLDAINDALSRVSSCSHDELLRTFEAALDGLLRARMLEFGPDHKLGGEQLELRVQFIFEDLGFTISRPRIGMEEFILSAAHQPSTPVVVEVKSREKRASLPREHLRQLDDYVFELSLEQDIRLAGLQQQPKRDGTVIRPFSSWIADDQPTHPQPHKGLLIFNGPTTESFDQRRKIATSWVSPNALEFAKKRGFCLLSFEALLAWSAECLKNPDMTAEFWKQIHSTFGILEVPTS